MKNLAIITGADGGMGSEITKAVAAAGYYVVMLCRTKTNGEKRKSQIVDATGNPNIEVMEVDLSSMKETAAVTQLIKKKGMLVDLLMNNAGTMSKCFNRTSEGFENTVAVNYLAPFLLTNRLIPLMHNGTRIVNMISCKIGRAHV